MTKTKTSVFDSHNSNNFIKKVQAHVPVIDIDFKAVCDSDLTIQIVLHSMKKGKSPGNDGLTVEFYIHFWELIKQPLLCMY